jgi:hypothetical protein
MEYDISSSGIIPRLLSRKDAAAYCGVSPNHFCKYIGPSVKSTRFGRRVVWDVKALDKYLDSLIGSTIDDRSIEYWLGKLDDDREG